MSMELVQTFNAELSSLYEMKPPISKAKMSSITKTAIKAIKMYKHIVQSVERFIAKCRPEYKLPGLYVIDSIVRQSRHQFGPDKDVFGPRFTRNFQQTFHSLFITCPTDDKVRQLLIRLIAHYSFQRQPRIVRVLNLWQRNNVFSSEIIQPLLDMANPNAQLSQPKDDDSGHNADNVLKDDPSLVLQLLANSLGLGAGGSLAGTSGEAHGSQSQVRFNKKLLDFDYGDDDDEDKGDTPTEAEPPMSRNLTANEETDTNPLALSMAQNLLLNPELLQKLQFMQQNMQQNANVNAHLQAAAALDGQSFVSSFQPLGGDAHAASAAEHASSHERGYDADNNFAYNQNNFSRVEPNNDLNNYGVLHDQSQYQSRNVQSYDSRQRDAYSERRGEKRRSSRSPSPRRTSTRFSRPSGERGRRSRSRSPSSAWRGQGAGDKRGRHSPPRQERGPSPESKERERERDRRRRGLPPIRKGFLTICSTTLWLGHVPKLVSEADISNAFGEFGTINSIDLIAPRGCAYVAMNRRQDAYNAYKHNSKSLKIMGNLIKVAWAPGKGMKGREFKDYWDAELGASFIPCERLADSADLDLLEEGGMIDEDTVPSHLVEARVLKAKRESGEKASSAMETNEVPSLPQPPYGMSLPPGIPMPSSLMPGQNVEDKPPLSAQSMMSQYSAEHARQVTPPKPPGGHLHGMPVPVTSNPHLPNMFQQPPPLNVPPPSVLSGTRPPPLPAWMNQPVPGAPVPISAPKSALPSPVPPFRGAREDLSAPTYSHPIRETRERPPPDDDPFAPSLYELKAMAKGGAAPILPPGPIPPQLAEVAARPAFLSRIEDSNHLSRFTGAPAFERRFNREWAPEQQPASFESRENREAPRDWQPRGDRERGDRWDRERNERNGSRNSGSFREQPEPRERERSSRWRDRDAEDRRDDEGRDERRRDVSRSEDRAADEVSQPREDDDQVAVVVKQEPVESEHNTDVAADQADKEESNAVSEPNTEEIRNIDDVPKAEYISNTEEAPQETETPENAEDLREGEDESLSRDEELPRDEQLPRDEESSKDEESFKDDDVCNVEQAKENEEEERHCVAAEEQEKQQDVVAEEESQSPEEEEASGAPDDEEEEDQYEQYDEQPQDLSATAVPNGIINHEREQSVTAEAVNNHLDAERVAPNHVDSAPVVCEPLETDAAIQERKDEVSIAEKLADIVADQNSTGATSEEEEELQVDVDVEAAS